MARDRVSLRAIAVFETVARLGSLKAASAELHLTPSAVSHQVRALEEGLGLPLFERESRGVKLSPAGLDYARRLHGLLDAVRAATGEVAARGRQEARTGIVRVRTPPSLANYWLMPMLPAFLDKHPGIDIRVIAIRTDEGSADDFDITIAYGDPRRGKAPARPLLKETFRPYCAPSLLEGAALIHADQLLSMPLIRSSTNDISWNDWFARRGVSFEPWALHHIQIDPSYVAIEAAVKGVGVVLESGILTQEHVQHGRLVAPVSEQEVPTVSYWLLPLRPDAQRAVSTTYEWLLAQGNCEA